MKIGVIIRPERKIFAAIVAVACCFLRSRSTRPMRAKTRFVGSALLSFVSQKEIFLCMGLYASRPIRSFISGFQVVLTLASITPDTPETMNIRPYHVDQASMLIILLLTKVMAEEG